MFEHDKGKQEIKTHLHLEHFCISGYKFLLSSFIMLKGTYIKYASTKQTEKERLSYEYPQQWHEVALAEEIFHTNIRIIISRSIRWS